MGNAGVVHQVGVPQGIFGGRRLPTAGQIHLGEGRHSGKSGRQREGETR